MSNNQNKKERLRIVMDETEKLEVVGSCAIETTVKIGKRINKMFLSTFSDYVGCHISRNMGNGAMNMNQQFIVELHFKPLQAGAVAPGDNRVRAFKPITEVENNNGGSIYSDLQRIYQPFNSANSKNFTITDSAAQILSEFMIGRVDPFDPKTYDQHMHEYHDAPAYMNKGPLALKLVNLDLTKLVRIIYGNKDEDGNKLEYGVVPFRPVNNFNYANQYMMANANWYVNITPINVNKLNELMVEMGMASAGVENNIITGY